LAVDDNAKVTRCVDYSNCRRKDSHLRDGDLLQLLSGSEPLDLSLTGVQTQLVDTHPCGDVGHADGKYIDSGGSVLSKCSGVHLTVVSILVQLYTMGSNGLTQLSGVEDEE